LAPGISRSLVFSSAPPREILRICISDPEPEQTLFNAGTSSISKRGHRLVLGPEKSLIFTAELLVDAGYVPMFLSPAPISGNPGHSFPKKMGSASPYQKRTSVGLFNKIPMISCRELNAGIPFEGCLQEFRNQAVPLQPVLFTPKAGPAPVWRTT
jgi:hypothetical protein